MPMPEKILVVEDERNIASFVSMYLKNARYHVEIARDGTEALQKADATKPDLVVLDLMLPDIDGLEVCRQIRSSSDVPILMLTARDDDVDKIVGLEVGADDYLTKPFNPRELVARIKSILRRSTGAQRKPQEAAMEHGNLRIDAGRREVTVSGAQIQLAPKEFDLLWELLDHRGVVVSLYKSYNHDQTVAQLRTQVGALASYYQATFNKAQKGRATPVNARVFSKIGAGRVYYAGPPLFPQLPQSIANAG